MTPAYLPYAIRATLDGRPVSTPLAFYSGCLRALESTMRVKALTARPIEPTPEPRPHSLCYLNADGMPVWL